jgi:putative membrane protein
MRIYLLLLVMLLLLAIAFIFGSQNSQLITLNYMVARAEITVAQAVSLFTLLGFILGLMFALLWTLLRSLRARKKLPKHPIT